MAEKITIVTDEKFKDRDPESTITYLKGILENLGVEVEEQWQERSSIGTWALRVTFKNTNVGSNGKGTTKLYATASAYAELFERFQNDLFMSFLVKNMNAGDFLSSYDEKLMSAEQLIKEGNAYINYYFSYRNMEKASLSKKVEAFINLQRADYMLYAKEDTYVTVPFYSVREDRITYLPQHIYRLSYGSNGMSAGNSLEEAFVQGVSEIYERFVQRKILHDQPTLPTIPEDYIQKFPLINEYYINANKAPGYKCLLKDCSFGGRYPVAALIVMEENTGRYGIKLGSHPDFGIAMERTFTEAAQGQDLSSYTDRSVFDFKNDRVSDNLNAYNTYKVGKGQFPYQLFGENPDYPFTEMPSVKGLSNRALAQNMRDEILADGYDVLIRNVSNLGFPSLHVMIPGMSEMFEADDMRYKVYNTRNFVMTLLTEPKYIDKDNCKYIITIMEYFLGSILENDISTYFQWYKGDLPAGKSGYGCVYFIAMCHYLSGDVEKAAASMNTIITLIESGKLNNAEEFKPEELMWYKAVFYFFSGMSTLKSFDATIEYLQVLFSEEYVERVKNIFADPNLVILNQYPDYITYVESGDDPYLDEYSKIRQKLQEAQLMRPIDQMINREIFE